ncbi:MAG: helix-hairpin-helix domain-containing protein [bacterium]
MIAPIIHRGISTIKPTPTPLGTDKRAQPDAAMVDNRDMGHRHALWLIAPILLAVAARLLASSQLPAARRDGPPPDCRRWIQLGTGPEVRCLDLGWSQLRVPRRCLRTLWRARLRSGDRVVASADGTSCEVRRMDPALIRTLGIAVDVNRAGLKELATLAGVGPGLARQILAHRRRHGRFRRKDELLKVRGIGPGKLRRMESRLIVGPDSPTNLPAAPIDPWENPSFPAKMGIRGGIRAPQRPE